MAASTTPAQPKPEGAADVALRQWWGQQAQPRPATVAVALSAGADSTALLLAATRLPARIVALHVHHGLQAAADAFERHSAALCERLSAGMSPPGIVWRARRVQVRLPARCSLEAQARTARYQALADMARELHADVVLLGHHADDQAESVLLALSRGAGVAGLAGMAAAFVRHGVAFARPLLALPASALKDALRQHGLPWLEDPSNANLRHTRNRLRQHVAPAFDAAVPQWKRSLARSARLAHQADVLLAELAALDLAHTGQPPRIGALQSLSAARQANALRHWLKTQHQAIGSEAQMAALLRVIAACTTRGHRIHNRLAQGYIRRNADVLEWVAQEPQSAARGLP